MALEVDIETGGSFQNLQEIISEIKRLKSELRNVDDEQKFIELTEQLGRARKEFKDFNDDVRTNAAGSTFEKMGIQVRELTDNLMNLNFKDAAGDIQNMGRSIQGLSFKELTAGFKAVTASVWQFTASLLANPMVQFALAAAAVVAVIVLILNKLGLLKPILDAIGEAMDAVIQVFDDFTDALGLTSNAIDKNIEKTKEWSKETESAYKAYTEAVAIAGKALVSSTENELKILEAQGASEAQIYDKRKELITDQIAVLKTLEEANKKYLDSQPTEIANTISDIAAKLKLSQSDAMVFAQSLGNIVKIGTDIDLIKAAEVFKVEEKDLELLELLRTNYQAAFKERQLFLIEGNKLQAESVALSEAYLKKQKDDADKAAENAKKLADERRALEQKVAEDLLKIQRDYESQRLNNIKDTAKSEEDQLKTRLDRIKGNSSEEIREIKNLSEQLLKATDTRIKSEEAIIKNSYKVRIDDNQKAIDNIVAQEKTATGEVLKSLQAQKAVRLQIVKELTDEEAAKIKELSTTNTNTREDERVKWQGILDATIKSESERIEAQRDEDIANARKALEQKIIDQTQFNEYVKKLNETTAEQINNLNKIEVNDFKSAILKKEALRNKFLAVDKASVAKALSIALNALETEKNARQSKLDEELKALETSGLKETEAYANILAEKKKLDENYTATKDALTKQSAELEKTMNAEILQLRAQQFSEIMDVALNANEAIAGFSEARANRELGTLEQQKQAELNLAGNNTQLREEIEAKYQQRSDDIQKKAFERDKKFAIAQALMQGALGIVNALAVKSTLPSPFDWIVKSANAVTMAAITAANVAKIKSTTFSGGGSVSTATGGGGGAGAGGGTIGTTPQPSFEFFGAPNTGNNLGATGGERQGQFPNQNITVDVKISEAEITNTQRRVAKVTNAAEL